MVAASVGDLILRWQGRLCWRTLLFEAKSRIGDYHQSMDARTFENYLEDIRRLLKRVTSKTGP